ncbi:TPR-like protein [Basidiobolus meristosporus CBS 931.73]|uniref:TPR-like protein n=1 Tax=Basidiobolus meristosporus CBS 931.73 TaxID=1314790 RepID=A0A1Y1XYV8_9FUNG|nr:TPR-like protein [Basidiobolus meristosporus CBS 931.73]|eukprot:ORX90554.1 TPR-like protein [Basidiobolus meristosporus CBS 931.73]
MANTTDSSTIAKTSNSESVKKFFSEKDWKFYLAVATPLVLAGLGAWYLSKGQKQQKPKRSKKAKGEKKAAEETSSEKSAEASEPSSEPNADPASMTAEEIEALPQETRLRYAQSLKSRGNSYFGSKDYDSAIKLYTQAIAFKPDHVYYANRAACYANLKEYKNVIEDCTKALAIEPLYVKALIRRAQAYEKVEQLRDSLHDFMAACVFEGYSNQTAVASMERMLKKLSDTAAVEILNSREAQYPSISVVQSFLNSFSSEKLLDLEKPEEENGDFALYQAQEAIKETRYNDVIGFFDQAIEKGCSHMAYAYSMRGSFKFLKGASTEALEDFNKSIEYDQSYVPSYIKKGAILLDATGNYVSALEEYEKAANLNPDNADVYYHRGQVYLVLGEVDKAIEEYNKSISLNSDFPLSMIQLGVAQYKSGSIMASTATFRKALSRFPENTDVHNHYGELFMDQQRFEEAVTSFDKAIACDPKNPSPLINKGVTIFQWKQDVQEAMDLCKQAVEVDHDNYVAISTLAQFSLQQGQIQEALDYFNQAIEVGRTQMELSNSVSFKEAALCQIEFLKRYPEHSDKLFATQRM